MTQHGIVAVVGARALPGGWMEPVSQMVRHFLDRGWGIGSGGAAGADAYALRAVVAAGPDACRRSVIYWPGPVPVAPTGTLAAFVAQGGRVVGGAGTGRAALLARSRALVDRASGVVAVLHGPSRGTHYTLQIAARRGRRVAVVDAGGGAVLPAWPGGAWVPCDLGGIAALRWAPRAAPPPTLPPGLRPRGLARIFRVPDGEPVESLLAHIAGLTPGERLWFEAGHVVGDHVLVPHERLDDGKPAALALDRLMRQLRCSAKAAFDLGECLLALDADPGVIAHYIAEARRRGVAAVVDELVYWLTRLEAPEPVPDTDALDHAEPLGEAVEDVSEAGDVPRLGPNATGEPATLAWRVLGSLAPEWIRCSRCRRRYPADDDVPELPRCSSCGTVDTWEARQPATYRALLAQIDRCPSRAALATLGRRLYIARLPRAQAGVAWAHYRLRAAALEQAVPLGPAASALLARITRTPPARLPWLGAVLYRQQRASVKVPGAPAATEWRRLWAAYRARRPARSASHAANGPGCAQRATRPRCERVSAPRSARAQERGAPPWTRSSEDPPHPFPGGAME
jgi:hypothetical protein